MSRSHGLAATKVAPFKPPYVWGAPASAVPLHANHPALVGMDGLWNILSLMRPDNSPSEWKLIDDWIAPTGAKPDAFGNYVLRVGKSEVLWSSHTDTVHNRGGRQALSINKGVDIYATDSDCLGADCGTGVWLMLQMIKAQVPGLYVFHRSEETGGQGSNWIAEHSPDLLNGIEFAIAFDRKDFGSIITHQLYGRCASETFSDSLAAALPGMEHQSDDGGTFTDTANYVDLVAECTNLSVGYFGQHTSSERQNLPYLRQLRDVLVKFDEGCLKAERKAGEQEYDWDDWDRKLATPATSMERMVFNSSKAVASILEDLGMDEDQLARLIDQFEMGA
jgi:hypothetical protein